MSTIIEKIRAEVNRRKLLLTQHSKLTYDLIRETFIKEYDDLLRFLSDLEKEEKPIEGLEEDVKSWFFNEISSKINVEHTMYYYFQECARRYYDLGRQSKPKVCEDKKDK